MGYVVNQYNRPAGLDEGKIFMEYLTSGEAGRRPLQSDIGVINASGSLFEDECIKGLSLNVESSYYFHGKIRREAAEQVFNIKLCYFEFEQEDKKVTQFIKQIVITSGEKTEWADIEFIFTPLQPFDCILFELQRTQQDFSRDTKRFPLIAYEELSVIKNILLNTDIVPETNIKLLKLGMQTHPGFLMCINQEEIRVGQTGIYEIKNGVITVNFFSVVNAAEETTQEINNWLIEASGYNDYNNKGDGTGTSQGNSRWFFGTMKTRMIQGFTLDYMFKENLINP